MKALRDRQFDSSCRDRPRGLLISAMLRPQLGVDAIPYLDRVRDDPRSRPAERAVVPT
jgi:hypothetical protein